MPQFVPELRIPRPCSDDARDYLETLEWTDLGDEPTEGAEWDESAIAEAETVCADFRELATPFLEALGFTGTIGHDLALTQNRHGTGFWDRGNEPEWRRLTELAHAYGSCDAYLGDDGKAYLT